MGCWVASLILAMFFKPEIPESTAFCEQTQMVNQVVVTPTPTMTPTPTPVDDYIGTRDTTIKVINLYLKNKLANKGQVIYDACKAQNPPVSAKLMTSIILVEVGQDCNSSLLRRTDNVGGLNWFEGCGYPRYGWYIDFSKNGGVDESIKMKAQILSRYIREGRTNIVSIGLKYAPPNDSRNGIGGMNNYAWPRNVEALYKRLLNTAQSIA